MTARTFPLEAKLLVAFVAGALGLVVALGFAAREGRAFLDVGQQSTRLRDLDFAVTSVYLALRTAESGQRGYLVNGTDTYLVPYRIAIADVGKRIAEAKALAAADPPTARALTELDAPIGALLSSLASNVELRRQQGFEAAREMALADRGIAAMRTIRLAWESIHADLAHRAEAARAQLQSHYEGTIRLLALGVLLGAILLVILYLAIARELRERRHLVERIRREADHDDLTQLPNRRFFTQWLGYALAQARREGRTLGLLSIDIDGFKAVNDTAGHEAGDALLTKIALRFAGLKRDSDVLARIGGDEFVLGAVGAEDGRDLARLAERLLDSLADRSLASVPIGASIGIAFFPDDASDPPGLLASADAAMYAAKRAGKNRVMFSAVAGIPETAS
jgi:diguanylate cyclase (GGDEF)-like protein